MVWNLLAHPCPLPRQTATHLSHLTSASSRTMQNYLVWRLVLDRIGSLSQRFKEARVDYRKVSHPGDEAPARARVPGSVSAWEAGAHVLASLRSETGTWWTRAPVLLGQSMANSQKHRNLGSQNQVWPEEGPGSLRNCLIEVMRLGQEVSPVERLERASGWTRETATRLPCGQDTNNSRNHHRMRVLSGLAWARGPCLNGNTPCAFTSLGTEREAVLQPPQPGDPGARALADKAVMFPSVCSMVNASPKLWEKSERTTVSRGREQSLSGQRQVPSK